MVCREALRWQEGHRFREVFSNVFERQRLWFEVGIGPQSHLSRSLCSWLTLLTSL